VRWVIALLAAALAVVGVVVVTDALTPPLVACPDDAGTDEPQADPEIPVVDQISLYRVDDGEMVEATDDLYGPTYGLGDALLCEYADHLDGEDVGECPTGGGGGITVNAVDYHIKVYSADGRDLLAKVDMRGVPDCDFGIVAESSIDAETNYRHFFEKLRDTLAAR
jgi:hypothetical protein